MATRFIFTPYSAEFPSTNFPELRPVNERPVLAFSGTTDESIRWTGIAPDSLTGTITIIIHYVMASSTSGTVGFQAQLEAVSDGDTVDLDSSTSFDSVNNSASTTVPGTAGYIDQISITMTNADSIVAGDYFRLSLNRDADGSAVTDSATDDCYVLAVELQDGA